MVSEDYTGCPINFKPRLPKLILVAPSSRNFGYSFLNTSLHTKFQVDLFICGIIPQSIVSECRVLVSLFEMKENFKQYVVIKFYVKFGFTAAKMFEMMKAVYNESPVSCVTVKYWHR